jgi:hypothetical protein
MFIPREIRLGKKKLHLNAFFLILLIAMQTATSNR